jgi:exoribonuclease II
MRLMKYILISFTSIFPQNELLVTTNKSIKHLDFLVTQLDDALSATRLPDGRIKVWIHVADPTCLVKPHSIIDRSFLLFCSLLPITALGICYKTVSLVGREAMHRGTSIFLPTTTFPMFPERLAMNSMSLQQGKECKSVTVSVILNLDGR